MSTVTDALDKRARQNGKRGSTNNKNRLEAFKAAVGDPGGDWGTCDSGTMRAVVVAITCLGGAVTFGLSRDNGAHSLTMMLDGHRKTMWYNGDADLTDELTRVQVTLEDLT